MIERTVSVSLPHRILFADGIFDDSRSVLREVLEAGRAPGRPVRVLVILEEQVVTGHPGLTARVEQWFADTAPAVVLAAPPVILRGGEPCKNDWSLVERLWRAICDARIDRHSYIMAVGGGALLDLTGFAAATAHRGIRFVRVPTTTLSQADGGVGVKNGVNYFGRKNWVGTFTVPAAVINDFRFLSSLPPGERRDGIIEAIKVALIRDREFFAEIGRLAPDLARLDPPALHRIIQRSAELHVEHICTGGDPFESGSARPLDFGHWAAHKLEQLSGFRISHGKAVAIGIALDLEYAVLAGLLSRSDCDRILSLIRQTGFRLWADELRRVDGEGRLEILNGLEEFREHLGGELCVTLVTEPGRAVEVHEMDAGLVAAAVERLREQAAGIVAVPV